MTSRTSGGHQQPGILEWRGLGAWNLYFIAKLLLYWVGALNFHALHNLVFAALLLLPLPWAWLRGVRTGLAIPAGIALLYYDTWFPPFSRLLAQPEVLQFSGDYLLELLGRFINWEMVGAGVILLVAYLYLSQYLRFTFISVVGLSVALIWPYLSWPVMGGYSQQAVIGPAGRGAGDVAVAGQAAPAPAAQRGGKPSGIELNAALDEFYRTEKSRQVAFPASLPESAPFDVLFINICSLSWMDLRESQLEQHPFWKRMDVIFDRFNSATSYSGPAVIRLLRASCGQSSQHDLYEPVNEACYLFQNLQKLGFESQLALNHDGSFQGFLGVVQTQGNIANTYIPSTLKPRLQGFDGSPIWGDLDALGQWWRQRLQTGGERQVTLYNTITLHDGNRELLADGGSRSAAFAPRAQRILDDLERFMDELDRSGRKVLVVVIPEHGAALEGDRMQIAGMREIPSPSITQVPVGVRLVGAQAPHGEPVHVSTPSSYLAVAELVSRLLRSQPFESTQIDWASLLNGLPETRLVSENQAAVLMYHDDLPYVRVGASDWIPYPQ